MITQLAYLQWIYDYDRQFKRKDMACWGVTFQDGPPVTGKEAWEIFEDFHKNQCALCGGKGTLFLDHCHESDLIRAYLCPSCNSQEGRGGNMGFDVYRRFYPTKLLNIELEYSTYSSWSHNYYNTNKFMTKEARDSKNWSEERCLQVYSQYLWGRVTLRWMNEYDFKRFLNRVNEIITRGVRQIDESQYELIRKKMDPFSLL